MIYNWVHKQGAHMTSRTAYEVWGADAIESRNMLERRVHSLGRVVDCVTSECQDKQLNDVYAVFLVHSVKFSACILLDRDIDDINKKWSAPTLRNQNFQFLISA